MKESIPQIGCIVTADGKERFSIFTRDYIDNRIGTCWVDNLNEFLFLCERLGYHVDMWRLNVFMQRQEVG